MNRDFLIDKVTPAIARKLIAALDGAKAYIDPKIMNVAKEDLIETTETDPIVVKLMQFIKDHDYRCVIPHQGGTAQMRDAIASMIGDQRVIFFDDPVHWNIRLGARLLSYRPDSGERFQFISPSKVMNASRDDVRGLCRDRDCLVVCDAQYPEHMGWVAHLFPKIILQVKSQTQLTMFGRNDLNNSIAATASVLYPSISSSAGKLNTMHLPKFLPLIGATNILLDKNS